TARSEPNALINDSDAAIAQVLQMIRAQTVTATNGEIVPIKVETICIHGDGANALEFARKINRKLIENSIKIECR
ncbi:MAG TPA: LamB/YcsF family protein, partial [Pyrinomonadaceae bacterium]|nr:LamB/YcsF family protein [Pyrinomonadaceae bacterium]